MKKLMVILITSLLFACDSGPEQLKYGTDACHFCKMTLMDDKFGAELVTTKDKVYKFDDMNCFLNFYNSGAVKEEDMQFLFVVDYDSPGQLINAKNAFYLKSEGIRSPMNGQIASFVTQSKMNEYKEKVNGTYLTWGELVTQYNK